ncbi:hypothetical protein ACIBCM_18080 [Streptomyces sp. NPDC051018]|uniref:hypothetical protein n=1 Tax=Streptomyces sp. NPDC051018 TaxID=3365639 RepID=UPI0037A208AF
MADSQGNIQAALSAEFSEAKGDAPKEWWIEPSEGQVVHEVDVPRELLARLGGPELDQYEIYSGDGADSLRRRASAA